MWASAASNSSTSTELSWMVPGIFVAISLVCPKGTQFDEIINMSQRNPPAQSNAIYLPAFPHLPSWLGTCFVDPGCVFKLNQNVSNPESSTWKSDSICAKASRSLPRASVKRLLSFRSDFNVVSSWDIWTFSAFSVALRENNLWWCLLLHNDCSWLNSILPCISVLSPCQRPSSGVSHCSLFMQRRI